MTEHQAEVRQWSDKESPTLGQFSWQDPFLLNDQLSEDETMIAEASAAFAAEHLAPRAVDAFENATVDPSLFRLMGQQGLLGVTLPEAYGGLGSSYVSYGLVAREIERVDSGYRSMNVSPIIARDLSHLCLWQRSSAAEIFAGLGEW